MMIFEFYIRRERILTIPLGLISSRTRNSLLDRIFGVEPSVSRVLWLLFPLAALCGGLITNDAVCILLTPIILDEITQYTALDHEALTAIVVGLPMAANIGSTWTVVGNPQIAFIISKTNVEFSRYVTHMIFASVVVIILHIVLLQWSYRKRLFRTKENAFASLQGDDDSHALIASRDDHDDDDDDDGSAPKSPPSDAIELSDIRTIHSLPLQGGNSSASDLKERQLVPPTPAHHKPASMWMAVFVSAMMILMVVLLLIPNRIAYFDLGLVPFGTALSVVIVDKLYFKNSSDHVFKHLDWSILLLFMGLFVWLEVCLFAELISLSHIPQGLSRTNVPARIWCAMLPAFSASTPSGIFLLSIFMIVGSNIVSNVPLVVLIAAKLSLLGSDVLQPALLASWVTTVGGLLSWCFDILSLAAGNLTLFGSVSNLIVAERAAKHPRGVKVTFTTFAKFGVWSTIITTVVGQLLLSTMFNALEGRS
jgi:Na+/H+ antiporter NhaD/arsenite permease-like protein